MGRFWAVFFTAHAVAGLVLSLLAPSWGWWFPGDGLAKTTIGVQIDHLFYVILYVVAVVFVGTHAVLGYVLWAGAAKPAGERALFTHGNHTLEVIWTAIPAAVLLFIAFYQMDVWAQYRIKSSFPKELEPIAEVTARQFEWRIRYPAPGKPLQPLPQPDDVYTVNDLRLPIDKPIIVRLRSDDVQHSFFVPELRVKQDIVPGKVIPLWFQATKAGSYEIVCAELCGWGHYKMKARLVASSSEDFQAWKIRAAAEQADDGLQKPSGPTAPSPTAPDPAESVQPASGAAQVSPQRGRNGHASRFVEESGIAMLGSVTQQPHPVLEGPR